MCIVADPPTFVPIFKVDSANHSDFQPIKNWVLRGGGRFVIGGSKYRKELNGLRSVLPLIAELARMNKIIRRPDNEVDAEEAVVKRIVPSSDFDDEHLVALIRLTGCRVVCTSDLRSHKYFKSDALFPNRADRPSIYSEATHSHLLCNGNIPKAYK